MERVVRLVVGMRRLGGGEDAGFSCVKLPLLLLLEVDEAEDEEDNFDCASLQRCWARVVRARLSA